VLLADYRDLDGEVFDAVCSIGMFEHVAIDQHADYFKTINARLKPGGLYLHHAIARKSLGDDSHFRRMGPEYQAIVRYIFPGGELDHLGRTITHLERNRFEIQDVEALRFHYMRTTQLWHDRLMARRDEAEREVGAQMTRLWLLYLAAVSIGFRRHWVGVFQTLVSKRDMGRHPLPLTREDLYRGEAV
jgi:cyclopropane-fatty-acyl-phospholipid synthase